MSAGEAASEGLRALPVPVETVVGASRVAPGSAEPVAGPAVMVGAASVADGDVVTESGPTPCEGVPMDGTDSSGTATATAGVVAGVVDAAGVASSGSMTFGTDTAGTVTEGTVSVCAGEALSVATGAAPPVAGVMTGAAGA